MDGAMKKNECAMTRYKDKRKEEKKQIQFKKNLRKEWKKTININR